MLLLGGLAATLAAPALAGELPKKVGGCAKATIQSVATR
jgi:hypothetical protein